MAGTRISIRPKKPTEKAAASSAQLRIAKTRARAPKSKPSPRKSKKRKAVSSDDDLVEDSDDSVVTAARTSGKKAASKSKQARRKSNMSIEVVELEDSTTDDEEEQDVVDRGGPASQPGTVDGENVSRFVLHFPGTI
jgi:hypothetical protein